jgi:hypothetical protein
VTKNDNAFASTSAHLGQMMHVRIMLDKILYSADVRKLGSDIKRSCCELQKDMKRFQTQHTTQCKTGSRTVLLELMVRVAPTSKGSAPSLLCWPCRQSAMVSTPPLAPIHIPTKLLLQIPVFISPCFRTSSAAWTSHALVASSASTSYVVLYCTARWRRLLRPPALRIASR